MTDSIIPEHLQDLANRRIYAGEDYQDCLLWTYQTLGMAIGADFKAVIGSYFADGRSIKKLSLVARLLNTPLCGQRRRMPSLGGSGPVD
jgi:hypothetical protein